MKKNKTYYESLWDVRWLRKRQKILKRDGYKCTVCGADANLQVHHTYYYKQPAMPWEYPNCSLVAVCDKCHNCYHQHHEVPIRENPKKRLVKKAKSKHRTLSQYLVQTTSASGKTTRNKTVLAFDKEHASRIVRKQKLPVFGVHKIK